MAEMVSPRHSSLALRRREGAGAPPEPIAKLRGRASTDSVARRTKDHYESKRSDQREKKNSKMISCRVSITPVANDLIILDMINKCGSA